MFVLSSLRMRCRPRGHLQQLEGDARAAAGRCSPGAVLRHRRDHRRSVHERNRETRSVLRRCDAGRVLACLHDDLSRHRRRRVCSRHVVVHVPRRLRVPGCRGGRKERDDDGAAGLLGAACVRRVDDPGGGRVLVRGRRSGGRASGRSRYLGRRDAGAVLERVPEGTGRPGAGVDGVGRLDLGLRVHVGLFLRRARCRWPRPARQREHHHVLRRRGRAGHEKRRLLQARHGGRVRRRDGCRVVLGGVRRGRLHATQGRRLRRRGLVGRVRVLHLVRLSGAAGRLFGC
mmetsp:Transcript_603/g.1695  ORF Transcript_603/g.1695 Transcript_603/m.1695 type:complete len:287 (-) Transcript_603:1202-2062(-)